MTSFAKNGIILEQKKKVYKAVSSEQSNLVFKMG
jgi:hypothetical protein